ncbi:MAG: XdhC family protein [Planctomycetota bacterium]|jgi:xanthine dehydrogenase accessory factor
MEDLKIYEKAAELFKTGENIALVTVISTTGSTPGKIGYKMLVWGEKPEIFGTVGGGGGEAEVIETTKAQLPRTENRIVSFTLGESYDDSRGICGGKVEFLLETFDQKSLPVFEELVSFYSSEQKALLVSVIRPQKPPEKILLQKASEINSFVSINASDENIQSIKKMFEKEETAKLKINNELDIFIEYISENPMVFIFGAGHLSYYIAKFAKELGFNVTVCDDRAEFANRQRFPDSDNIIVEKFENVFEKLDIGNNSYIVIVTKGHKWDEIVLENALKRDAKYIGMIGSKRKTLTLFKRLSDRGFEEGALNKVFSPIGVSIGALTPQEIALSIVCELVKERRAPDITEINHMKLDFSKNLEEGAL